MSSNPRPEGININAFKRKQTPQLEMKEVFESVLPESSVVLSEERKSEVKDQLVGYEVVGRKNEDENITLMDPLIGSKMYPKNHPTKSSGTHYFYPHIQANITLPSPKIPTQTSYYSKLPLRQTLQDLTGAGTWGFIRNQEGTGLSSEGVEPEGNREEETEGQLEILKERIEALEKEKDELVQMNKAKQKIIENSLWKWDHFKQEVQGLDKKYHTEEEMKKDGIEEEFEIINYNNQNSEEEKSSTSQSLIPSENSFSNIADLIDKYDDDFDELKSEAAKLMYFSHSIRKPCSIGSEEISSKSKERKVQFSNV
ncbi:unnamed protein product [Moneuplotes crassus]|uniref:Uncharacterized protein n=1 Tax=Euplotes crassus TaxID=5936 RepID=A0AAD1UM65_EUPCR|nr:unnamed protein product [Moneuplotes crassus]